MSNSQKQKIERACYNPFVKGIVLEQYEYFQQIAKSFHLQAHNYEIGDDVKLNKFSLLHGIRDERNFNFILQYGFIASDILERRSIARYPKCANFYNAKRERLLSEYIDEYSGCIMRWMSKGNDQTHAKIIPLSQITKEMVYNKNAWIVEQLKESRFMPSKQNNFSILAFILNLNSPQAQKILKKDILNVDFDDNYAKFFVNNLQYQRFLTKKHMEGDLSGRESHIIYGVPNCFVEGILVNRDYENDQNKLKMIKTAFPNCYICNLDGKVIVK